MIARAGGPGRRGPAKGSAQESEGPEALGPVLRRVVKGLRLEERSREGQLAAAWEKAAGPDLAGRARPVEFARGLLTVEVEGASLLQEIRGFRSREILRAVREQDGGDRIREIRFVPAGRSDARGNP